MAQTLTLNGRRIRGRVSRETDQAEVQIYDRLIEWQVWVTGSLEIAGWEDHLLPHKPFTVERRRELAQIRRQDLTDELLAIEKAVAGLQAFPGPRAKLMLTRYLLDSRGPASIAMECDTSEEDVVRELMRAVRILARTVERRR